jgi:hypothetical protein
MHGRTVTLTYDVNHVQAWMTREAYLHLRDAHGVRWEHAVGCDIIWCCGLVEDPDSVLENLRGYGTERYPITMKDFKL